MTIEAVAKIAPQDPRAAARRTTVVVAYLTVIAVGALLPIIRPSPAAEPAPFVTPARQVALFVQYLVWLVPLLVAMERDPNGRFWKLIFAYVVFAQAYALAFTGIPLLWTLGALLENVAIGVLLHLLLAFPSGHLRDRLDRAIIGAIYAYIVAFQALEMTTREVDPLNLLGRGPAASSLTPLVPIVQWCVPILAALFGIAIWRHWRDASPAARRALLPIVVTLPLFLFGVTVNVLAGAYDIGPIVDFFDHGGGVALGFVFPVAFALGVLRLRFRRGRVADLVVELGRGVPLGGLRDVLARTLDDPTMELAFAAPSGEGFVDAEGLPYTLPTADDARSVTRIEHDGEILGVLVHDPAIESEDPGLVEAVGNAAALALENEALAAQVRAQLEDVRASRARIVDAADAERRRVERDLHDGAQQRLVALALRLQVAKQTTEGASALLDEATAELEIAIGEVRGLARGLHPMILTEAGLAAALDALAERAPLPVTVEAPDRRYEPVVDATAYFVVAEALTNVARHAGATHVRVTVVDEGNRLVLTVEDDGRGGAEPERGTGLRGLTDRLAAVGGGLTISSPPGGGTTLRAEMPLRPHTAVEPFVGRAEAPSRSQEVSRVSAGHERWPSTPKREPRDQHAGPVGVTALAATVLAIVVVGAVTLGPRPVETSVLQRDASFARPFDYFLPPSTTLAMDAKSDSLHVLGTRSDDGADGLSFWLVTDVLDDPCLPDGGITTPQPGPAGLLAHLQAIDGLAIAREAAVTIDGRPATQLDLTVAAGHEACRFEELGFVGMSLWRDASSPDQDWIFIPQGRPVPVTILDVDGATVVIETWSYADINAWRPTAEGIIGSIRFHHGAGPGPSISSDSPE